MWRTTVRLRQCQKTICYRQIQTLHRIQHKWLTEKLQAKPDDIVIEKDFNLPTYTKSDAKQDETVVVEEEEFNLRKYIKLYKILSKWNLSMLNGVVTGSTAFICSGGVLFGCTIPATIGCISLAISASTLNQLQEYKYDSLMFRTKLIRPLCTGKLTINNAKIWSLLSMSIGISILSIYCGNTAAIIGISTLFMYNAIYTPLKRITPYNTEFGAIIGALPPQIGIAASHYNSSLNPTFLNILSETINDPLCWYSFILLYIWQMPHFLYLSIRNKNDYIRGGFKMWSTTNSDDFVKKKSIIYTSLLLPLPLLLSYSNITSFMFAFDGTILNTLYFVSVYKWYNSNNSQSNGGDKGGDKAGKSSFYFNLLYLPTILFLMTIHSKRWKYKKGEFFSTHMAYLQDLGNKWCLYNNNNDDYEPSGLPDYNSCTSPFRNEIHSEKPLETLTIHDD